jgi:hypothetical protein
MTGQPRAIVVTAAVLRASGRSRGPLLTVLAPIEPWTIRVSNVEGCWHLQDLRATADPVLRALLDAPLDDEPETAEKRRLVQEARDELARGEVRTLEEVRRERGVCVGRSS